MRTGNLEIIAGPCQCLLAMSSVLLCRSRTDGLLHGLFQTDRDCTWKNGAFITYKFYIGIVIELFV